MNSEDTAPKLMKSAQDPQQEPPCVNCARLSDAHQRALAFMKQSEEFLEVLTKKHKALEEWEARLANQESDLQLKFIEKSEKDSTHKGSLQASVSLAEENAELTRQLKVAKVEKIRLQSELIELRKQQREDQARSREGKLSIMTKQGQQALQPPQRKRPPQLQPPQVMNENTDLLQRFEAGKANMKM